MLRVLKKYVLFFFILLILMYFFLFQEKRELPASGSRLDLGGVAAEILFFDVNKAVKRGSKRIIVVRFLENVEFRPYHFEESGLGSPKTIEEWAEHLDSPVVINAGQFDEYFKHIGWLKRQQHFISRHLAPAWKALLVSGPKGTKILDLERKAQQEHNRFPHALQSMMLIDEHGTLRVRDTDLNACRSVLAEDKEGRILLIVTEGAITLGDLGRWLASSPLAIKYAMNLDGGIESQLALRADGLKIVLYGQYGTGTTVFSGTPGKIRYPLPAVLAMIPLRQEN